MAIKTLLSSAAIAKLPVGEIAWDTRVLGLGAKRTTKGATLFLNYLDRASAKYKRVSIGTLPAQTVDQLRTEAAKLKLKVAAGENPAEDRATPSQRRNEPTLASSLALWQAHPHGWALRTKQGYKRLINKYVDSDDGAIFMSDLKRTTIISIIDEARVESPSTAAALRRMFGSFLTWADHRGLCELHLPRQRHVAPTVPSRERVMSDEEIAKLWKAADGMSPLTAIAGRLTLICALRSGAVVLIRREWLDDASINFPAMTEGTKKKRGFRVPLTQFTQALIKPLREREDAVFSEVGSDTSERLKQALPHWRMLAGLDKDLRLHDVRRAMRTWAARKGYKEQAAEAALTHETAGSKLEATYNLHTYEAEAEEVWLAWQKHVEEIVNA